MSIFFIVGPAFHVEFNFTTEHVLGTTLFSLYGCSENALERKYRYLPYLVAMDAHFYVFQIKKNGRTLYHYHGINIRTEISLLNV